MKTPYKIIDDPVKSTLFGKFYEKIVAAWLTRRMGFEPYDRKPRIYWEDVKFVDGDCESALKLNGALKKHKDGKKFCTPDGIFQKNEKFYIWEAKNWPLWNEGKKPLDQLRDLLFSMPFILATKAVYRGQDRNIHGILFSWWSKPEGSTPEEIESLLRDIRSRIAPRTFELFYTADILEECIAKQYPWYLEIIKDEQARIDTFFRDLLGQQSIQIEPYPSEEIEAAYHIGVDNMRD
jgi:hypothetical protein